MAWLHVWFDGNDDETYQLQYAIEHLFNLMNVGGYVQADLLTDEAAGKILYSDGLDDGYDLLTEEDWYDIEKTDDDEDDTVVIEEQTEILLTEEYKGKVHNLEEFNEDLAELIHAQGNYEFRFRDMFNFFFRRNNAKQAA